MKATHIQLNIKAKKLYAVAFPLHSEGFTDNFRRLAIYCLASEIKARIDTLKKFDYYQDAKEYGIKYVTSQKNRQLELLKEQLKELEAI